MLIFFKTLEEGYSYCLNISFMNNFTAWYIYLQNKSISASSLPHTILNRADMNLAFVFLFHKFIIRCSVFKRLQQAKNRHDNKKNKIKAS